MEGTKQKKRSKKMMLLFFKIFRKGETSLEKNLSSAVGITFVFAVTTLGYWISKRFYSKWTLIVLLSLLLFVGTFGLRVRLVEKKKEIKEMTRGEAKGMGLSLNEAKEYERKKVEVDVFKQWIALVTLILVLGGIFLLLWPF